MTIAEKNPLVSLHQVPWKHGRAGMTYLYAVPGISSSLSEAKQSLFRGKRVRTIRPEAVLVEGQDTPSAGGALT